MQEFYLWTHISRIITEYLTSDMHANSCLCTLGRSIKLHISRNSNINVIPVPFHRISWIKLHRRKQKKYIYIYNRLILMHYYCSEKVTRIFFQVLYRNNFNIVLLEKRAYFIFNIQIFLWKMVWYIIHYFFYFAIKLGFRLKIEKTEWKKTRYIPDN